MNTLRAQLHCILFLHNRTNYCVISWKEKASCWHRLREDFIDTGEMSRVMQHDNAWQLGDKHIDKLM